MRVSRVVNSFYASCTYVLNGCCVVDCGDVKPLLPLIQSDCFKAVFLTHGHYDHIYGLNELCEMFPSVVIYCSEWTARQLLDEKLNISFYHETPFKYAFPDRIVTIADGDRVVLNEDLSLTAIHTPGHTPGCVTWMTDEALFTGDAYIPGVKVVTKLPFGNRTMAAKSLELIKSLAEDITIYPGHSIEQKAISDRIF